jgi:hypothetical protein
MFREGSVELLANEYSIQQDTVINHCTTDDAWSRDKLVRICESSDGSTDENVSELKM